MRALPLSLSAAPTPPPSHLCLSLSLALSRSSSQLFPLSQNGVWSDSHKGISVCRERGGETEREKQLQKIYVRTHRSMALKGI